MNKKLVLIVDDEPMIRNCFKMMAESFGYVTEVAEDGIEGYTNFCKNAPDIIILDFKMPIMDGPSLANKIRTSHPETKTRIIGCTGFADEISKENKRYFDEILHKPVDYDNLKKILDKHASCV